FGRQTMNSSTLNQITVEQTMDFVQRAAKLGCGHRSQRNRLRRVQHIQARLYFCEVALGQLFGDQIMRLTKSRGPPQPRQQHLSAASTGTDRQRRSRYTRERQEE